MPGSCHHQDGHGRRDETLQTPPAPNGEVGRHRRRARVALNLGVVGIAQREPSLVVL